MVNIKEHMYKQVIVVRGDVKMSRGKIATQVAHASLEAFRTAPKGAVTEWSLEGAKKVVLKARDLTELRAIYKKASELKLPVSLIRDAGHTELRPGTLTCVGIGPERASRIDRVTGSLKPL